MGSCRLHKDEVRLKTVCVWPHSLGNDGNSGQLLTGEKLDSSLKKPSCDPVQMSDVMVDDIIPLFDATQQQHQDSGKWHHISWTARTSLSPGNTLECIVSKISIALPIQLQSRESQTSLPKPSFKSSTSHRSQYEFPVQRGRINTFQLSVDLLGNLKDSHAEVVLCLYQKMSSLNTDIGSGVTKSTWLPYVLCDCVWQYGNPCTCRSQRKMSCVLIYSLEKGFPHWTKN